MGTVYGCHKSNGSICVGWLMKQDENYFPSIALRLSLTRNNITREYLDSLHSPSPIYKNVEEMVKANFPELLKKKRNVQEQGRNDTKGNNGYSNDLYYLVDI